MADFPPKQNTVSAIRASCSALRQASVIALPASQIDALLHSLDQTTFERLSQTHGILFPLRFDSVADEVNFLSVLALLNGLSGYRTEFHQATGSGVYDNILKLLVGLYLDAAHDNASHLSASGLASLASQDVSRIWGVTLMREMPHATLPGIVVGERTGTMVEPVDLLVKTCNETGQALQQQGFTDLGSFVLYSLRQGDQARSSAIARAKKAGLSQQQEKEAVEQAEQAGLDAVVHALFSLPGFADRDVVDGQPVALGKKIFFLLYTLSTKFSSRSDFSVYLPPTHLLPMFVDNVLPTMLHQAGVLDVSSATVESLRDWQPYVDPPGTEGKQVAPGPTLFTHVGYRIRAAALDAGSHIVQRAHQLAQKDSNLAWMATMTESELDGYLWSGAKDDPALRRVPRMVQRGTIMF